MAGQSSWPRDSLQRSGKHGLVQSHYPIPPFELAEEQEGHWEQKRGRQGQRTQEDRKKVTPGPGEDRRKVTSGPGKDRQEGGP